MCLPLPFSIDGKPGNPLPNAVQQKYTYMERPTGTVVQQADVAVDALARLCLNLPDGEVGLGLDRACLLSATNPTVQCVVCWAGNREIEIESERGLAAFL